MTEQNDEQVEGVGFAFEFYSEVPDPDEGLRAEAADRLLTLTKGHDDLVGAAVTLEELTGETTPHEYEAKVVVYKRPNNLAATETSDSPAGALRGSLRAVERQVRESREKLRKSWT